MLSLSTSKQIMANFQFDPSRGIDFETDIKLLRRSRLMKQSEFTNMLLTAERFQRDAKLSSLTRKDKNQLAQQAEDAQFFRILLRMMMEVSRSSGIKQRDDLRKVYHWYSVNKEVLHCEPHFKGAGKQLYKRPELKFSEDAIKYYSDPPGHRKHKQVAFQGVNSPQSTPRGQRSDEFDDLRIEPSRPTTAPSGLSRPKIHNSLRSPRNHGFNDDASFAVNYINAYLNNQISPKLGRPSSAMGVIRHAQISTQEQQEGRGGRGEEDGEGEFPDDLSAKSLDLSSSEESNISSKDAESTMGAMQDAGKSEGVMHDGNGQAEGVEHDGNGQAEGVEHDGMDKDDGTVSEEEEMMEDDEGEETKGPGLFKRPPPITALVNPVARMTFEEEESYHGGQAPEMSQSPLLRVQVDMPSAHSSKQKGQSPAELKAANMRKWNEYQERQTGDLGSLQDQGGDRVVTTEVPERFTQEVIANYAAQESFVTDIAPGIPPNSLASKSLETFYKHTENHAPKVNQSTISPKSARRLQGQSGQGGTETKHVTIVEGAQSRTIPRVSSARIEREPTLPVAAVVEMADDIGDKMMVEREPNGPEMPAGFRKPSSKVSTKRPATAPSTRTMNQVSGYVGMGPPPNSSRVSSGENTPEYTPRNKKGEPIFALPEESPYNVHFRRSGGQTPVSPVIPHSISRQQSPVAPDSARYMWRDDGHGNMTYRSHRIQSAPVQRTSMRTAGSTRGGNRPRTATSESAAKKWHSCTACESSIRLPQAASHRMKTMHPVTIASMLSIKALGGDQRRMSSRMGHRHTGTYPWDNLNEHESGSASVPPNMQYMSISTPAPIKVRNATDGSKAPNQSTESLMVKDTLHSPSRLSGVSSPHSPLPNQGWFMGESSNGEPTITADGGLSTIHGGDGASSTMMAPSERSFDGMSDVDLADLTDQSFSPLDTPRDTPRTPDSGRSNGVLDGEGAASGVHSGDVVQVGAQGDAEAGGAGRESRMGGASMSPDFPDAEAGETGRESRMGGASMSPHSRDAEQTQQDDEGGEQGAVAEEAEAIVSNEADNQQNLGGNVKEAESGSLDTAALISNQTEQGGEPVQTGSSLPSAELQVDQSGSKQAVDTLEEPEQTSLEADQTGMEAVDVEQAWTEQASSSAHTFKVRVVARPSSSSSSSSSSSCAVPNNEHSFVPVEIHENHGQQYHHPHHLHHHHHGYHDEESITHQSSSSEVPKARIVTLDLGVSRDRSKGSPVRVLPSKSPTAYMKLSENDQKQLKGAVSSTHPTAATNATPEYTLMMPAVSNKPLTPRGSPQNSRPTTPNRSPRHSPVSPSLPCPRYARSTSPSVRGQSPASTSGHLSPGLRNSPCGSHANSRSPSPCLSQASLHQRPRSGRSKVTSPNQAMQSVVSVNLERKATELGGGGGGGDGMRAGLMSLSSISITAEDAEVSAITDDYDDLGIIDDDGASISIRTPDGLSSGGTSPSITVTMDTGTSDQGLLVPGGQVKRPSSAPGSRTRSRSATTLGLPTDDGKARPGSARGPRARPRSARRAASPQPHRPTSPRPTSARFVRPLSPRLIDPLWKGRPVPEFGQSNPDMDYEQYLKQQEAKSSVSIQKLFSKSSNKETKKRLSEAERARKEKKDKSDYENERAYLEHLWRREMTVFKHHGMNFKDFEREYMLDKLNSDKLRKEKRRMLLEEQAAENRRRQALLKRIGPSVDIHELFNAQTRGVSKAQMKRAAIIIQRYVRGMIVRRMLARVKEKSRIHAGSFKSFIKYYYNLMKKIARWHGAKKPKINLDLWEMDEFCDKKKYYEYIFAKRIHPETQMAVKDLSAFMKECDHHPSAREINNAIVGATSKDLKKPNLMLKEREVSEVVFMIYVPRGTGLLAKNVRKSTWLNPLVDGEEAKKMMGSSAVKDVNLQKSLQLVFDSMQEHKERLFYEERVRKREEEKEKLETERLEKEREEQEKKLLGDGEKEELVTTNDEEKQEEKKHDISIEEV